MLSLVILLIYTATNTFGQTCNTNQTICRNYADNWCCSNRLSCGDSYNSCIAHVLKDSSDSSSDYYIYIIVSVSLSLCCVCVRCWLRQQSQEQSRRQNLRPVPTQRSRLVAQNQRTQRTPVVTGARPTTAIPVHLTYEEPPPSYEAAIRDSPYKDPTVPTTGEDANLRV